MKIEITKITPHTVVITIVYEHPVKTSGSSGKVVQLEVKVEQP